MSFDGLPVLREIPSATAAQMAEIDRIAIQELGLHIDVLMESASRQIASAARAILGGRVAGKHLVGLVGSGNNGGDAAGALRHLANWGARVRAEVSAPQERLREPTRQQLLRLTLATGDGAVAHQASDSPASLDADLVLDGLLGYSTRGAPHGVVARLIDGARSSGTPVLAIDLPSGLDPDTGTALGLTIHAAATVTLALPKSGLLRDVARDAVGTLVLADIGIPPSAFKRIGLDTSSLFAQGDLVRIQV